MEGRNRMAGLQPALSTLPEALEQSGLNIFCFSILKLAGRDYTAFGKCRYSFGWRISHGQFLHPWTSQP